MMAVTDPGPQTSRTGHMMCRHRWDHLKRNQRKYAAVFTTWFSLTVGPLKMLGWTFTFPGPGVPTFSVAEKELRHIILFYMKLGTREF